jgi:lipopolysaccharide/colanic/teichoic acid biosynthesis glycosyltransferase
MHQSSLLLLLESRADESLHPAAQDGSLPELTFRYRVLKRALDVFLVILLAPFAIPIVLVICLFVRISSRGPCFFSHCRHLNATRTFAMWKFRTMHVNAAELLEHHLSDPAVRREWNLTHKLKDDPRLTPIGSFLRRTSLDELPQLWNVFQGSMSMVGPRPIVTGEIERYNQEFSSYCRVKPGITGLWQVSGRSTTTYDERVRLDSLYVEQWSLGLDVSILSKTLLTVVNQHGAY